MGSIVNPESTMPTNLEELERDLADRDDKLAKLRTDLDLAADAGNEEEVGRLHPEISKETTLRESAERRVKKARADREEEEKVARRQANIEAEAYLKKHHEEAVKHAANVDKAIGTLVARIKDMHAHGEEAKGAIQSLIRQQSKRDQEQLWSLAQEIRHSSSTLGIFIEDALQRAGLFRELAPHPSLRLIRHGLPPMGEHYTNRVERMTRAVRRLVERANEAIQ
ncbi:MAG: hypothetical protein HZY77_16270 [Thiobacillus sp.]|uniref:hypothetical protein n=1 Tax=Thiobacillus sp. TaxID=924 RepID=UPI00168C6D5F|nr:hypothetical protein [Thiobacillus sp.]QLQ04090.1 MAG: hypothetical protein HZY77_16270 [Thiobacillus sp.]